MIQLLNNALWQQKKYVIADVKHQAIRSLVFSPLIGLLSPPFARLFNQAYFEVTFFAFQTDAGTTQKFQQQDARRVTLICWQC